MLEQLRLLADLEVEKARRIDGLRSDLQKRLAGAGASPGQGEEMVEKACDFARKAMLAKDPLKVTALKQVDTVVEALRKMPWAFLDVPAGDPDLLLGDHPVLVRDAGPDDVPSQPLGLANPHLQAAIPISRQHLRWRDTMLNAATASSCREP